MPTAITHKIYDGTATTLPEIISNLMHGFFWDFRDGDRLTRLDDIKAQVQKRIDAAAIELDNAHRELRELDATTDEALLASQAEHIASSISGADQRRAEHEALIRRLVAAEEKLAAWEPPQSVLELKEGMLRHLREQIDYERRMNKYVGHVPNEMSAAELRKSRREWRLGDIKRAEEKLKQAREEGEEEIRFRTELYAEFERIGLKVQ